MPTTAPSVCLNLASLSASVTIYLSRDLSLGLSESSLGSSLCPSINPTPPGMISLSRSIFLSRYLSNTAGVSCLLAAADHWRRRPNFVRRPDGGPASPGRRAGRPGPPGPGGGSRAGRLWETMPAGGEGESSAQRVPCGAVARSSGRVRTARVQACHPDGPSPRTGRWQLLT